MTSVGAADAVELFAGLAYTLGYFSAILALVWRPAWTLVPFAVMLAGALFLEHEHGPLLMGAIILALASYAVTMIPLSIMVAGSLAWEIGWRVLHDAVDGRLLWPIPFVILLLIPGRSMRLLVQRTQREHAAAAAREDAAEAREEELVEQNKKQRLLVSRELHDVVAHELTRIAMQSSVGQLSTNPGEQRAALEAISASARTAMTEMRRLVRFLNEEADAGRVALPGEGVGSLHLRSELQRAASYLTDLGFHAEWSIDGDVDQIPPGLLPTGVTILREATTNAVKHSSPGGRCQLSVAVEADSVTFDIRNEVSERLLDLPASGVGLAGLRARVTDLNGTFSCGQDDRWWIVTAELPMAETTSASHDSEPEAGRRRGPTDSVGRPSA